MQSRILPVLLAAALALAGCTTISERADNPMQATHSTVPAPEAGRYEAVLGQDATALAELRAAPAPDSPAAVDGHNQAFDEQTLGAQGFLRIGTGTYPSADADMRAIALHQGQRVGADRALFYPAAAASNGAAAGLMVAYYVHFKPPFGASYRDLNATERQALAVAGGVSIGAVVGGSPAAAANLLAGDAVLRIDGKPIANRAAFKDMLSASAGRRVVLSINRDGAEMTRIVRVGLLPPVRAH